MKKQFTNNVNSLLAQQLIEEQAQVAKHQAIIDEIQNRIIDEKMNLIREVVRGRMFRVIDKTYAVIGYHASNTKVGFYVVLDLAENPDTATVGIELSEKEEELMEEYRKFFDGYYWSSDDRWEKGVMQTAMKLTAMNDELQLLDVLTCEFDYSEATNPSFFERTGVEVGGFNAERGEARTLEDAVEKRLGTNVSKDVLLSLLYEKHEE